MHDLNTNAVADGDVRTVVVRTDVPHWWQLNITNSTLARK
jgi:hypothetical protein